MSVVLASAWKPRGELARFSHLVSRLNSVYASLVISLPPDTEESFENELNDIPNLLTVRTPEWSWGRWLSIHKALKSSASHIHYVDFDRLLRWIDIDPTEWEQSVQLIRTFDYLVFTRSSSAYATHPKAIIETEAISNRVVSSLISRKIDVSAGSKGFSRKAAKWIVRNTSPGHALGTDGEWTVGLFFAGFEINTHEVNGLDWESADRNQDTAASSELQFAEAKIYDQDASNWQHRVGVALEVVECAYQAENQRKKRQE